MAKDAVDHYPCLHLGGVGQHLPAVDIADGVDARDGGLEVVVDGDSPTVIVGEAGIGEVVLHIGLAPRGHEDDVGIDVVERLYGRLHVEGDAALLQELAQTLGHIGIHHGQALFQVLNDRDFSAEAAEYLQILFQSFLIFKPSVLP